MTKKDDYRQFLRVLFGIDLNDITPDMITQDSQKQLDALLNLCQQRRCESCLYKQLEHTDLWCYMFKEMPKDCHKFRKGECKC